MYWQERLPAIRIVTVVLGILVPIIQYTTMGLNNKFPPRLYDHVQTRNILLAIFGGVSACTSGYLIYTHWLASKRGQCQTLNKAPGVGSIVATIANITALCVYLFSLLDAEYLDWLVRGLDKSGYKGVGVALKTLSAVGLALQVAFVSLLIICLYWPTVMFSDCLITVFSILQLVITVATLLLNYSAPLKTQHNQIYVILPTFLACAGFVGAGVVFTISAQTRLQAKKYTYYHIAVCALSALLCGVWFFISVADVAKRINKDTYESYLVANPILASCGVIINLACIWCATMLNTTPQTKLRIEEYDLSDLSPEQLNQWAALIDAYNNPAAGTASPDIARGQEALDLMKAYVNSPMPGFDCRVLRVYDDSSKPEMGDELYHYNRSYNNVKAWQHLDDISLFDNPNDSQSVLTLIDSESSKHLPPKLSKNALKRAQRKASKKQKGIPIDIGKKTPEEIDKETAFRQTLMSSEALILLTTIHDYDLTGAIKGRLGSILQHTLGSKSWFKPLCIKFGILGSHWPFRQMIFYTAPTKKPTARNAAILAAVSRWNNHLPRSQRCSVLYNPCYGSSNNSKALSMSGWQTLAGPPSHVSDLRPYKSKTCADYLKAIKYRNQATAFQRAQGQVHETTDFSPSNCCIAIDLWHNIAAKRTSEGHTAVLKNPTAEFLERMGCHNPNGYRKLLFLKVDGEVIASCVLFFLGNTLTSDMQGLDHDKARQYKAYFVMMQETITIALREGIPFVDFGPTTGKAKLDIGCSEIPLLGGIKVNKLLSAGIGFAAGQMDV